MKYLMPTFTLAANTSASQKRWDFSFMTKKEFMAKYKITDEEYEKLKNATNL